MTFYPYIKFSQKVYLNWQMILFLLFPDCPSKERASALVEIKPFLRHLKLYY